MYDLDCYVKSIARRMKIHLRFIQRHHYRDKTNNLAALVSLSPARHIIIQSSIYLTDNDIESNQ